MKSKDIIKHVVDNYGVDALIRKDQEALKTATDPVIIKKLQDSIKDLEAMRGFKIY